MSFKPCTTECIIPLADHSFEHNTFVSLAMPKGLIINFISTLDPTPGTTLVLVNTGSREKEYLVIHHFSLYHVRCHNV